jgi:Rod binding domain-containing protein
VTDITALGRISSTISSPVSASAENILKQAQSSKGDSKKIDKAAMDFESILMNNVLQGMQDSFGKVPGTDDEEDNDSGGSQFLSMGMQSLSTALAGSGGIGIAKMISKQLHRNEGDNTQAAPAPATER